MHETLGSVPNPETHTHWNDGTPHSGGGESEVGSHPLLRNKLETDSLGHMRLHLKKK